MKIFQENPNFIKAVGHFLWRRKCVSYFWHWCV